MCLLCFKRIAVLSVFSPYRGGIAQFNQSMCAAFESEGHDVVKVNFSRQYPQLLFPGKSQFEGNGKAMKNALLDSINPLSWNRTARFISNSKPHLLVVPFWQPLLLPALTAVIKSTKAQVPGIRVIGLLHNATSHESQFFAAYLIKKYLRHLDSAWTLSAAVAAHPLVADNLKSVQKLFHPVYTHFPALHDKAVARQKLHLPAAGTAHVLLFFGLVRGYKGLDVLMQAMPMLQEMDKPVHLLIAGECYEDWSKYERLIVEAKIQDATHVHSGFIENADVPMFFGAADLVCLPYRSASQSGVTAIAIQYGIPVVASAVGGLTEYFEGNSLGTLCKPNDPHALAKAVRNQLAQPCLAEKEIESVQQRFSWQSFAREALKNEAPSVKKDSSKAG